MKLDKKAFGLASGILWGLIILVSTFWVMARGGGSTLALLEQFYFGYSVSYQGAFIGLIYGFIDGFICGWIFAWLYNKLIKSGE
jgi:tetrahydromethanopterin S-methyltransferase subunit F